MLLTSFLDLVLEKFQKLTKREVLVLLLCIFILVIFLNGISFVPHDDYLLLSQNPFTTRTDIFSENYFQESVLLPVIAFFFNLNSRFYFYSLCLFILLAAYLLFTFLTIRRYNALITLICASVLMTSPLTTVLFSWLGTPDGLTFALTIPFLFVNSAFLMFFLAVLGTINHAVFIFAASEILILRWLSQGKIKVHHLATLLFGWASGHLLVRFFFAFNHIHLTTSRLDYVFSRDLIYWLRVNAPNFPVSVFSLFNSHWLIILVSLIMFFKLDKAYYTSLLIILLLNYGITFFTEDTTRVFSLLSWGILLECIFHSYKIAQDKDDKESSFLKQFLFALIIIVFISFISLRYYSWIGVTHVANPIQGFLRQFVKF